MDYLLATEEFERMKEDICNKNFSSYVDTWDFEDGYSHNDIETAREIFIRIANTYFETNNIDCEAKTGCERVYIFDKKTGERLFNL